MIEAAFDTSGPAALAVSVNGDVVVNDVLEISGRDSDRQLVPWVVETLEAVGVVLRDISRWTVGTGPGGFAGIRVGISFVNGICAATGAPSRGLPSSMCLCAQVNSKYPPDTKIGVLHDARRNQLILSVYRATDAGPVAVGEPSIVTPDQLADSGCDVFLTSQENIIRPLFPEADDLSLISVDRVDAVFFLGLPDWDDTDDAVLPQIEPVYVRPAVFVKPRSMRPVST